MMSSGRFGASLRGEKFSRAPIQRFEMSEKIGCWWRREALGICGAPLSRRRLETSEARFGVS